MLFDLSFPAPDRCSFIRTQPQDSNQIQGLAENKPEAPDPSCSAVLAGLSYHETTKNSIDRQKTRKSPGYPKVVSQKAATHAGGQRTAIKFSGCNTPVQHAPVRPGYAMLHDTAKSESRVPGSAPDTGSALLLSRFNSKTAGAWRGFPPE